MLAAVPDNVYAGWSDAVSIRLSHNKLSTHSLACFPFLALTCPCPPSEGTLRRVDVSNLIRLRELHLEHNKLQTLPTSVGFLPRLTHLNLAHNRLTYLPASLGFSEELQTLDVTDNELVELPRGLGTLKKLTLLKVCERAHSSHASPLTSSCRSTRTPFLGSLKK